MSQGLYRNGTTSRLLVDTLAAQPGRQCTRLRLAELCSVTPGELGTILRNMLARGHVVRVGRAEYRMTDACVALLSYGAAHGGAGAAHARGGAPAAGPGAQQARVSTLHPPEWRQRLVDAAASRVPGALDAVLDQMAARGLVAPRSQPGDQVGAAR